MLRLNQRRREETSMNTIPTSGHLVVVRDSFA